MAAPSDDDDVPRIDNELKVSDPLKVKEDYERQLGILKRKFGRDHFAVADCYSLLGVVHQQLRSLQQAKECHQNALEIRIKLLGHDHTDVANSYCELGVVHRKMCDLQQARKYHERALDIRVRLLEYEHTDVANSYKQLGVVHQNMGELQQAKECHENVLDIHIKLLGPDHTDVADSHYELGVLHQKMGDLQRAKECHERALDIRVEKLGHDHTDVADSYNQLGVVHQNMGDLQQAKECHERTLDIRRKLPGRYHTNAADSCDQLSVVYKQLGDLQQAEQYQERATMIRIELLNHDDDTDDADSYDQLGVVHQHMGDLQGAKQYHKRALDIRVKLLGHDHTDVAGSYNQLGVVHQKMGMLQQAKEYYERALDIWDLLGTRIKQLGSHHTDVAASYNQLGVVHQQMGDLQRAKECHERTLDIRVKLLGQDDTDVAASYNQLGVVHQEMGDLQQAKQYYESVLAIRLKLLGRDHIDVAASYNQLGLVNQDFGDLKQAKKCHERALKIRVKLLGNDNMDVSDSCNSLSSVYLQFGNQKKANQLFERAQAIREKLGYTIRADDQPDDILYNNAYHRALNAGQANNTRIPIMIVGQDRAGKTSLKKHLLGLPFDSQEPSTNGIDVDVVELTDRNAEDPWKRKEVKQFMMSEKETKKQIFKQAAQFSSQQQASPEVPKKPNTSNQAQVVNNSGKSSLSRAEIDHIKSLNKNASYELPPIRVFVHDLAGQDIYHDTHYYFLRLQCLYVVVYDLRKPFGNPAQPRFKPSRVDARDLNNPLLATNMDYFLSWLTVLARLRDSASDVISNEFLNFKLPPVLIVLTNSDRFEGNIDEVKNRIKDILIEKGFENVFTEFYVVDNSSSGEGKDEVRKLRGKLYCLCKAILDNQPPVPIRWLQFESSLSNKMVAEQLTCIPVEVARDIAESCNVENVDAAIRFLHHQGVIVHHVGSPVVVLNPQWLMSVFAEIITVSQEDNPCDAPFRKLMMKEGILMQEYLERKRHGKVLEKLMVQFGLICPWEHKGKPAFIVPSVAPLVEHGEDVQRQLSASPIASVFFKFQRGYVLPGLFTRFLVGMINKCREFLRCQRPRLFCNYALLSFQHSEAKFDVYIIKQLASIKIGVVPRATVSQRCCVMFASYLKGSMVDCLKSIKDAEQLLYWSIDASLNVKCSVCFGEHQPCLRHAKDKCENDDCGHFWSVDELQGTTEDPICDYASVVGIQEFPLEDAKPWISVDNLKTFSRTECCSLTNAGENEPSCSSSLTQADQPTNLPVLELSISNLQLLTRQEICKLLDVNNPVGGDFRELAGHFEMSSNNLDLISQKPNPTHAVLNCAAQDCGNTIGKLREILLSMGRHDCVKIIEDCFKSGGTSTSS